MNLSFESSFLPSSISSSVRRYVPFFLLCSAIDGNLQYTARSLTYDSAYAIFLSRSISGENLSVMSAVFRAESTSLIISSAPASSSTTM